MHSSLSGLVLARVGYNRTGQNHHDAPRTVQNQPKLTETLRGRSKTGQNINNLVAKLGNNNWSRNQVTKPGHKSTTCLIVNIRAESCNSSANVYNSLQVCVMLCNVGTVQMCCVNLMHNRRRCPPLCQTAAKSCNALHS